MSNQPISSKLNRLCREAALILVSLALASVPFTAAQVQITAHLVSTSFT